MSPLRVAIVGGGIGGMAVAAGLARNGHDVTVYERAASSGGVGFSFRITANSDRCLRHLGIDSIAGGACASDGGTMRNAAGEVINQIKENTDVSKQRGASSVFAFRPQVHQQLWDAAVKNGAHVRAGVKVKAVDAEKCSLTIDDGEEIQADLLIGSDGVHSVVRPQVVDVSEHYPKQTSGHNAFRFMLDTKTLQQDSLLGPLYQEGLNVNTWMGPGGKFLIAYPVDFGKQVNLVCTHHHADSDSEKFLQNGPGDAVDYNQKVSAATALALYRDFDPAARRFLELADPDGFRIWRLMDMEDLPRWWRGSRSSSAGGCTVLLGDACHPVLPFGFSGASMALEDAAILSGLLPAGTPASALAERLQAYEDVRRPRVARVRDTSRLTASGGMTRDSSKDYRDFLQAYDAVGDAEQRLAELLGRREEAAAS